MNLVVVVLLVAATTASAQKITYDKVPATVKSAFSKAHPDVNKVSWEKEHGNYEAGFTKSDNEISEIYTPGGIKTETEMEISVSELPPTILQYVKMHCKGAAIKEGAKITKSNGEVNYEAEVKGKDLIFDSKGNLVNE